MLYNDMTAMGVTIHSKTTVFQSRDNTPTEREREKEEKRRWRGKKTDRETETTS